MEASWNKLSVIQAGESHPLLPHAIKDAALLSAGSRYEELVRRTQDMHGRIDAQSALRLMDCPVAMKSNLHNALFAPRAPIFGSPTPRTTSAGRHAKVLPFNLNELLAQPEPAAKEIPLGSAKKRRQALGDFRSLVHV